MSCLTIAKALAPVCAEMFMGLNPECLLSKVSKERCITNIKKLPGIDIRGGVMHPGEIHLVPVCVDQGEVCLLYALKLLDYNAGLYEVAFPSGKMNRNETVYNAALRMAKEEIGARTEDVNIWTKMSQVVSRRTNIVITPVIGELKNFKLDKLNPNEYEISELFTVPVKVFCDNENHGCFRYNNVIIPVYNGGKHKVWGIPAMITHRFLYSLIPCEYYVPCFLKKQYSLRELMPAPQE